MVLGWAVAPVTEAELPIRIGASASKTGTYAALGQNRLRGYQLCVKHTNEKGGVLGRKLELVVEDDQSQAATAIAIYERLITREKVDLVLGPYGTPMTEPVADIPDKYKMPMISPTAAATAIFKKGRKFIFMVYSPAEVFLEGLVDVAAKRGVRTVAASLGLVTPSSAQQPIRIGTSLSKFGEYAKLANPMHLGYQRCMKHTNQNGGDLVQVAR